MPMVNVLSNITSGVRQKLFHKPYTCFNIVPDNAKWVLDYEAQQIQQIACKQEIPTWILPSSNFLFGQCTHYTSQFFLFKDILKGNNRVSIDYYHGMPETEPVFSDLVKTFQKKYEGLSRIRVSHSQIEDLLKNTITSSEKIFRIPIGIDDHLFQIASHDQKRLARKKLGIPNSAQVVGSFQKDGVGWGEGNEPKLIKGPDIFLETLAILKPKVPELFVLLAGPARGYVRRGLEKMDIPYVHRFFRRYENIIELYQSLDAYLITSREEGGPKAALESMASGVPLVTTRVGQAMDLVRHRENGWMVDVGDIQGLSHWMLYVLQNRGAMGEVLKCGRETAEANSYRAQAPLWQEYFKGFIERN